MIDLRPHASEILPRLWVGSQAAAEPALRAGLFVCCVLEGHPFDPYHNSLHPAHLPILENGVAKVSFLDEAAKWITKCWGAGRGTVLVHCGAGIERSPLVLAWWMCRTMGMQLDEAYAWLMKLRPEVQDRRQWLERLP